MRSPKGGRVGPDRPCLLGLARARWGRIHSRRNLAWNLGAPPRSDHRLGPPVSWRGSRRGRLQHHFGVLACLRYRSRMFDETLVAEAGRRLSEAAPEAPGVSVAWPLAR